MPAPEEIQAQEQPPTAEQAPGMVTLNINGVGRIRVSDSFKSMSPEEQAKAVEEIAGQIKAKSPAAPAASVSPSEQPPPPEGGSWLDPFVGQGILMGAGDEIKAGVRAGARRMFGNSGKDLSGLYNEELANTRADLGDFQVRHPTLTPALEVAGAVATTPLVPGGVAARGASLGTRIGRGAATGAGYGAVSGFASGDGTQDRLAGAAAGGVTGAALGGAAPAVVRGAQAVGRGARDYLVRPPVAAARGAMNRNREAARRIGMAMQRDDTIVQPRLTPADEAVANASGSPVLNLDRGGETVRALARSSANTSPEARIAMQTAVSDRYATQGDRTSDTVRRIVGGMGAPATLESLERSARAANRSAYQVAYREGDRGIWSPTLERLTSSPAIVKAMRDAAERGKDRAVVEGFGGFRPGVTVDPSGIVTFRRGANGQPTYPNLQYWDYVKRELDDTANAARRVGKREEASTLGGLAEQLRGELDTQVPSFANARAGAARFFGARDALEAGQEFVSSRMDNDAARQALARMSAPERELFSQGFADALTRRISEVGDRRNVINSLFIRSPASRERIEMALGPQHARELEAFLHVEALLDRSRTNFGNSTTARQLTELGLAGGAGGIYGLSTGDWSTAGAATIAGLLVRRGMGRIDQRVAQRVGEMLASPDPAVVQRGLRQVANNGRIMDALRYADIPAALGATEASNQSQPLKGYLSSPLGGPSSLYQPPTP